MNKEAAELAALLLREAREELGRADSKAAMLLASFGLFIGIVLSGLVAGDFKPADLDCGTKRLWWTGCLLIAVAVLALARAIYPNLTHGDANGSISYFGHAASLDPVRIEERLERQVKADRPRVVEQLSVISDLVWLKYRCLQVALWAFGAGVALCGAAVAFG